MKPEVNTPAEGVREAVARREPIEKRWPLAERPEYYVEAYGLIAPEDVSFIKVEVVQKADETRPLNRRVKPLLVEAVSFMDGQMPRDDLPLHVYFHKFDSLRRLPELIDLIHTATRAAIDLARRDGFVRPEGAIRTTLGFYNEHCRLAVFETPYDLIPSDLHGDVIAVREVVEAV